MAFRLFWVALVSTAVLGGAHLFAYSTADDTCDEPGKIRPVCFAMKQMASQIGIISAQRELNRVNFDLLRETAKSLNTTVRGLLIGGYFDPHMEGLSDIEELSAKTVRQSLGENPEAFRTANGIRRQCLECHSEKLPASGIKWKDLTHGSWEEISTQCNNPEKNPFICRQMHALVTYMNYFSTGLRTGEIDFEMAEEVAKEASHVLRTLTGFETPIHAGGNGPLLETQEILREVEILARQKNSDAFQKAMSVSKACLKCHAVF